MADAGNNYPRGNVLGVAVSAINMADALAALRGWVERRETHYVCVTPAHAVMACVDQPDLRLIYNQSGLTTPDGMPIVWLLRRAGFKQVERVYGPDLMLASCGALRQVGCRHYFYGGAPGVAEKLAARLSAQFPGLQVVGLESPPFRELSPVEDAAVVARIRAAQADIVWVGIGSPRQERWMSAHVQALQAPALVGVGAAFDFLSGAKPQAPRWMQRSGLEWLFRLASEPGRLWKRYLLNYPRFVALVLLQELGLKRFPIDSAGKEKEG
jgi:N-acetylglucosaminyldiphosphoundecaprenol N-acetyl-beta-D-mannosaminyltransferase